jgi:hypothetical protein
LALRCVSALRFEIVVPKLAVKLHTVAMVGEEWGATPEPEQFLVTVLGLTT